MTALDLSDSDQHSILAYAAFGVQAVPTGCITETLGICVVLTCPSPSPEPEYVPNAGDITIRFGFEITMVPGPGGYGSYTADQAYVIPGESVSVSAEGADVPPFSAELTAPEPLVLTGPEDMSFADRDVDLELAWDDGAPGVFMNVAAGDLDGEGNEVRWVCVADSTPGQMTIPAVLLGKLHGFSPITLYTVSGPTVRAGDYDVSVQIGIPVRHSEGRLVNLQTR